MCLKLVGRHVPEGVAECFDVVQQLFAAALKEISGRNGAREGVCKATTLAPGRS